jgi:DNA repair exonuclease SbcCD ATPase subunit
MKWRQRDAQEEAVRAEKASHTTKSDALEKRVASVQESLAKKRKEAASLEQALESTQASLQDYAQKHAALLVVDKMIAQEEAERERAVWRRTLLEKGAGAAEESIQFFERALRVVHRDGIPAFLCAQLGPRLNRAAQEYSSLFSESEIGVQFTVESGELDVQITNAHGGRGTSDQSQGELRMAGLIAAFTLRSVLVPYNLLILDEPGDGLDGSNARVFALALKEVAERFGTLFITTHNPIILSALSASDHHVHVVKTAGEAVVEVKK